MTADALALGRRRFLVTSVGAAGIALMPAPWRPASATPVEVAALIKDLASGAPLQPGRVKLDLPLLVENGNSVTMTVGVAEVLPPAERVLSLHVFAEGNPLPNVAHFHFGPRSGRPRVSTRIRLATSQTVIAVAKLADGSCWTDSVELLVTLAACLE
ncbi:thiosulfate oxidation carrier protein SoxY [Limobrevibacterium gyesilva]|uniref:Thiosulfate oxidation carrier protein SoxY n=1 Tax=Limobrevibacterium gyesilva TaxID=2991712 RepID=A0AA41YI45_9PROT|nr:thiosulfate oxidation carrier protein SoxY [Limobrevibacterium gyesilva]MCW3473916.1 thiosulfate oxidation carrier protein SoxY [Limobrevibacterium gyesilva]